MPILGSSSSAANKDMMSKEMDKWGYKYLIKYKPLWEKEKLLLFPQCFQKLSVIDASKGVSME